MQLLSGQKQKVRNQEGAQRYCQIPNNKLHPIIYKRVVTPSTKADDTKIQENSQVKQRKISRYFTERDPLQIETEIEREVCEFFEKNKELNYFEKERFLRLINIMKINQQIIEII